MLSLRFWRRLHRNEISGEEIRRAFNESFDRNSVIYYALADDDSPSLTLEDKIKQNQFRVGQILKKEIAQAIFELDSTLRRCYPNSLPVDQPMAVVAAAAYHLSWMKNDPIDGSDTRRRISNAKQVIGAISEDEIIVLAAQEALRIIQSSHQPTTLKDSPIAS